MKILLTGAFGNVGTSTLQELLARGYRVRCFDVPTRANLRAARRLGARAEVVWGDLRRYDDVAAAVRDVDVVIHLAFIIPKLSATGVESEAHPKFAFDVNVGGTRNLVRALQCQPKPAKIIFSSSVHVYGNNQSRKPPRTVDDHVEPAEHYSRHKVACERLIRGSGIAWSIFRFGAVLPISLALDPGMFDVPLKNRIEYVHTLDVGVALANAVTRPEIWGKTLLIGGGASCQFTYGEMVGQILEGMGVGMLPEEAFGTAPFATDYLDTRESQRLLQYQRRDLNDYVRNVRARLGYRGVLIRVFRPIVRAWLLRRSPYLGSRMPRRSWEGRVALVTGASSGIGAATARLLASHGLKVAIVARRGDRLESVADEITAAGGQAISIVADLTREDERLKVAEAVTLQLGPVDVLVNNAGIAWYGFGEEMSWQLAWQMIQLNLAAAAHFTLQFLPQMKARRTGHIINIGSIAGSFPSQGVAVYGATKAFIDNFSTALHRELRAPACGWVSYGRGTYTPRCRPRPPPNRTAGPSRPSVSAFRRSGSPSASGTCSSGRAA